MLTYLTRNAPRRLGLFVATLGLALATQLAPVLAGPGHSGDEGHSHDAPAATSSQSPRVMATSEKFQLVGILKNNRLTLFLDRDADNSPVVDAIISVTSGDKTVVSERQADGTYTVGAETLVMPGENDLQFEIKAGEQFDLLGGVLALPAAPQSHSVVSAGFLSLLQSGSSTAVLGALALVAALFVGAMIGALFGKRLPTLALVSAVALSALLGFDTAYAGPGHSGDDGHAHGPDAQTGASDSPRRLPDGSVFLPKPTQRLLEVRTRYVQLETARWTLRLAGRVVSNPNASAVVQSTVEGRIAPVNGKFPQIGQTVKAGEILAVVQPVLAAIDRSDVEQSAGNLDQQLALAQNKLDQFRKFSTTFSPERVKTAEIEVENLKQRRAALNSRQLGRENLLAPIDGVIMSSQVQIGQVVASKDALFNIVQPNLLWVEALAYDDVDIGGLGSARATAQDSVGADLKLIGANPALAQHATVLRFEVVGAAPRLRLGRIVSVLVEMGEPVTGIVLPRSAVVQAPNGQHVVFRHIDPERFEPKPVTFIEIDATRAMLTAGIEPGAKIAVDAATLINQIR
ncbi:MAG: efflux RND transporter periplasmic adaptor subunit [Hyphomicrobium aestuarii]|nr:efflux RND transporter periplasmic adaptor subunit [Hyphomicrobium aestuarii]